MFGLAFERARDHKQPVAIIAGNFIFLDTATSKDYVTDMHTRTR